MSIDTVVNASDIALTRAQWQACLFAVRPSRIDLIKLRPFWPVSPLVIRVHRNHSFEHISSVMSPWLALWESAPDFIYTDYDDSLSFTFETDSRVVAEIVWIDVARYTGRFTDLEFIKWLTSRIETLRSLSASSIIISIIGASTGVVDNIVAACRDIPGTRVCSLSAIESQLGPSFFDDRTAKFSGTRLSDAACLLVAREFACHWLPAMLRPRLKAVAMDLDHTLYRGVLGEDGHNVELTNSHIELQKFLLGLRKSGVLLSIVSRNLESDVKALFEARTDFPLRWEHFSATAIGWGNKADSVRNVANIMRIGVDAIVFLDDNAGELAAVANELPSVSTIHADPNASLTCRALEYYPRLWAWETTTTDALRAVDLAADSQRDQISRELVDPLAYLRSLEVKIRLEISPRQELARLHELSIKTNQFNLRLSRLSEVEVSRCLDSPDERVVAIRLSDRLSDSGLIGAIFARLELDKLVVYELAVSCRALGRRLEDIMITSALRAILAELPAERVEFLYGTGPRNEPARDWLARFTGLSLHKNGSIEIGRPMLEIHNSDSPITLEIIHYEIPRS